FILGRPAFLSLYCLLGLAACSPSVFDGSSRLVYTGATHALLISPSTAYGAPRPTLSSSFSSASLPDGSILLSSFHASLFYNAKTDLWIDAGSTAPIENFSSLSALPDGRIMATGGVDTSITILPDVLFYSPSTNEWTPGPPSPALHAAGSATLLEGGKVMVSGGFDNLLTPVGTSQIFDGTTWAMKSPLNHPRSGHLMAALPGGKVIVAGGTDDFVDVPATEIFDPQLDQWMVGNPMPHGKRQFPYITLKDGRIFSAGGSNVNGDILFSAEIYDPATGLWSSVAPMSYSRQSFALGLLPDGRVIAAGGYGFDPDGNSMQHNSTEIFDPGTSTWSAGPFLAERREGLALSISPEGTLIAHGGVPSPGPELRSTEIIKIYPTKVPLTINGGTPPFTYSVVSGAGFTYDSSFYSSKAGTSKLQVKDSKGHIANFDITVE
ncbi:MAG: hypothetical protein EOP06_07370, partial [Proteobacteria bacterium]